VKPLKLRDTSITAGEKLYHTKLVTDIHTQTGLILLILEPYLLCITVFFYYKVSELCKLVQHSLNFTTYKDKTTKKLDVTKKIVNVKVRSVTY